MHDRVIRKPPTMTLPGIKVVYADGQLTIDDYQCSKQETLAFANLLFYNYQEIVDAFREEQREQEAKHDYDVRKNRSRL